MTTLTDCARSQQDKSDSPQYFICLKNGRWRPVNVSPGTFAVMYRGQYRVVFSRAETDEEYFRNHPELPFRLTLHRSPLFRLDYFEFEITTADPEISATGDKWDAFSDLQFEPGTPRERVIRACLRMLTDPNRLSGKGNLRLTANPDWWGRHKMSDADLWRLAMRVIEPETSAPKNTAEFEEVALALVAQGFSPPPLRSTIQAEA